MQYGDIFPNKEDKGYCTTFGIMANSSLEHCYFNHSSYEECMPTSDNMIVEQFDMQNTIATEFGVGACSMFSRIGAIAAPQVCY